MLRPPKPHASRRARASAPSRTAELEVLLAHIARRRARGRARVPRSTAPAPGPAGPDASPGAPPAAPRRADPDPRALPVRAIEWVTGDLARLFLERPPGLDYRPGQHVKLRLGGVAHSYSLVSAPHEPFLELFIERVPGGRFSEALAGLRPGDTVGLAGGPKGDFTLEPRYPAHLMIATVTGIGPFVSMLRDAVHHGGPRQRFVVLQGASFQDELAHREELEALGGRFPEHVSFIPTVSRPGDPRNRGWQGEAGRVHEVAARRLGGLGLAPDTTLVYACGHPGMVEAARDAFSARGFRVKTEAY